MKTTSRLILAAALAAGLAGCGDDKKSDSGGNPPPAAADSDLGSLNVYFVHADYTTTEDCVEPGLCLTRGINKPVSSFAGNEKWACGACGYETSGWYPNISNIYEETNCWPGGMDDIVGQRTCLEAPSGKKYDFQWTAWTSNAGGGGFGYYRDGPSPDGIPDATDNCPKTPNADQADADSDGVGDACDICVAVANPAQADVDRDGFGDACEDSDGDGVLDAADVCPLVADPGQADVDLDGVGDLCDNCVDVANPGQEESERNGLWVSFYHPTGVGSSIQDCIEPGVCITRNTSRALYSTGGTAVQWACGTCGAETSGWYTNTDSLLQNCARPRSNANLVPPLCLRVTGNGHEYDIVMTEWESGRDATPGGAFAYQRRASPDGLGDACDNCPTLSNLDQVDANVDGIGDACLDSDGDAVPDALDNCPYLPNPTQADADRDGLGDACDNCAERYNRSQTDSDATVPVVYDHASGSGTGDQDCIVADVCLTRGASGGVINGAATPAAIEWACGVCGAESSTWVSDITLLKNLCLGGAMPNIVNRPTCLRSTALALPWTLVWSGYESGGGGGFGYSRSQRDGHGDACDNCSAVLNPTQTDSDAATLTFTYAGFGAAPDPLSPGIKLARNADDLLNVSTTPNATSWACGPCSTADSFSTFMMARNDCGAVTSSGIIGKDVCLRDETTGELWTIRLSAWTAAGFTYTRSWSDGFGDACDNCWLVQNASQTDTGGTCAGAPYTVDPLCGDACRPPPP